MRNLFALLALASLFVVTGCAEKPIEEAGYSTPASTLSDDGADCCVEPDNDRPDEPQEPATTEGSEPDALTDASETEASESEAAADES
jgi:hypothetical protein